MARFRNPLLWVFTTLVFGYTLRLTAVAPHLVLGDTRALVDGIPNILTCLSLGITERCDATGFYPPIQYLPALILTFLGAKPVEVMRGLTFLNFACFWGLLVLIRQHCAERDGLRPLWPAVWIVILSGPLFVYSRNSFGEMLAAFLTAWAVLEWIARAERAAATGRAGIAWEAMTATFLVALTKDFALVFMGILTLGAVTAGGGGTWNRGIRNLLLQFLLPAILGAAVIAGFNLFRFGTIENVLLQNPVYRVPDWKIFLSHFAALWLSPNSGLIISWPLWVLAVGWVKNVIWLSGGGLRREGLPLLSVMLTMLGLTLGLALWWSPFGWMAWGPRLLLPWLPAMLLIVLTAYPGVFSRPLAHLGRARPAIWWLTSAAVMLPALIQFGAHLHPVELIQRLFLPVPGCAEPPVFLEAPEAYYRCMGSYLWTPGTWVPGEALIGRWGAEKALYGLFYLGLIGSLLREIKNPSRR